MKRTETKKDVRLRSIVPISVIVAILLFVLPFMETKIMSWYAERSYDHDMKLTINLDEQSDEFDGFGCSSCWWSQVAGNGENAEEIYKAIGFKVIDYSYPEPIENTFAFSGFSILHAGSMLAMLVVGLLTIVACLVFVKKDKTVPYKVLDKLSVLVNFAVCFLAIPFITICTAFLQLTMSTDNLLYQIFLCTPALTAFTVAASVTLRRNGFTKTGFFVQFVGPVLFFVPVALESVIYNIFG